MQDQDLQTVSITPGVFKELSEKAAEGHWVNADKVRFRFGKPEVMGGWQNITTSTETAALIGVPRALEIVHTLIQQEAALVGTNVGVFSTDFSTYYNVTPAVTTMAVASILNTSVSSTRIVVSVSAHGMTDETFVSFVSATATIGGNIVINAVADVVEIFQVSVIDQNSFAFDFTTTAAATSLGVGTTFTLKLHQNAGARDAEEAAGYGTDVYGGDYYYGTPPEDGLYIDPAMWSFDLWGTDILAVPYEGPLFLWSTATDITSPLTIVTAAPAMSRIVKVATESRHVCLYGTQRYVDSEYDPLLVRWCSQEDYDDWTPTVTNTSGEYRLTSRGSHIITAVKMADKIIILTDADMFVQTYIGGNDIFGFVRAGESCGAISQNCAVEYGGVLYWMSTNGQFYKYDGRITPLPCSVLRYVYKNMNVLQQAKIVAGTNSQFDEIIWFYPSNDPDNVENDRYVIYNTVEQHWTIGTLSRTAWRDRSTLDYPLAAGPEGEGLYYHESGYTANGEVMEPMVESGFFDKDQGNSILFANKFVPDFTASVDGPPFEGEVLVTLRARKYPGGPIVEKGPYRINETTKKQSIRLRGREFSLRLESDILLNEPWRMGDFRMAIQEDGER